jgi:Zn-dependent protease
MLQYLTSISAALGLLNMVPVYYLDGQWAAKSFIYLLLPKTTSETKDKICSVVNLLSTLLLISALLISVINILF